MHIQFSTSRKRTARNKNRNNTSRKRGNRTVRRTPSPPRKVYRKTPKNTAAPTSAFAFTQRTLSSKQIALPQPLVTQPPLNQPLVTQPPLKQPLVTQPLNQQQQPPKTEGAIVYGRIFAEWCGACKALKPTWEKVTMAVGDKSVDFSAEDIELEERNAEFIKTYNIPLPPANGYPTIFKLRAKGGTPELYEDERSVDKLVEWILK